MRHNQQDNRMNSNDFLTVNQILADLLINVDDEEFGKGFTKGFYVSKVQQALEELAFDTFYQEMTKDLPFPTEQLNMPLPTNCFNIREIYLFNGECCEPSSSVIVHWKRLYNNSQGGAAYTAKKKQGGNRDPFFRPTNTGGPDLATTYFANIQNGLLMFSSNSASYAKVRLVYNGMGGEIGDEPVIPRFLRQAVIDWASEQFWRAMKAKNPRLRPIWMDTYNVLMDAKQGSWKRAQDRLKQMDTWEKDTMREYLGRMNY